MYSLLRSVLLILVSYLNVQRVVSYIINLQGEQVERFHGKLVMDSDGGETFFNNIDIFY